MSHQVEHRLSHASLLQDVSTVAVRQTRRIDAIVVPASRPSLQRIISFSAGLSIPLVVLCSRQAQARRVAERVEETFGARALLIDVPSGYQIRRVQPSTSDERFREVSGGRASDLSLKRNLGLLFARLRGWHKILFVDDDIFGLRAQDITRLAGQLDRYPVAAMRSWEFPDNSVVCHAGRLAGMAQDVFVSGAVLGVNTRQPSLPFFPDVYNEDWFFFARHAAQRALPKVGEVRQDEYQPFADPTRATREEFGDLLAEGLYSLFESMPGWGFGDQLKAAAKPRYWESFMEDRHSLLAKIWDRLEDGVMKGKVAHESAYRAMESLRYAKKQLAAIASDVCVEFIESWRADDDRWRRCISARRTPLSEREALDELELDSWVSCGYGSPDLKEKMPV